MAQGPARLDQPEILRHFRGRFVAFDDVCRNAIMGVDAEIKRIGEWLKGEQQLHWKKELRRLENAVNLAQNEYNRQRFTSSGKPSQGVIDAKKALDKVKRVKEETQGKLDATKRWATKLDGEIEKSLAAVKSFSIMLEGTTPRALARLDRMSESIEAYMKAAPPPGGV